MRGKTAFERMRDYFHPPTPVEQRYFNPLQGRVGGAVRFSHRPGFDHVIWKIFSIRVYERQLNKAVYPLAEYHLVGDGVDARLRVFPSSIPGQDAHSVLLQQRWPEEPGPQPWGDESPFVIEALNDPTKRLIQDRDLPSEVEYERDMGPVRTKVVAIADVDNDGTITEEEVAQSLQTLWLFRRAEKVSSAQIVYHLHAHFDGDFDRHGKVIESVGDKTLVMYEGTEVAPMNIMLY